MKSRFPVAVLAAVVALSLQSEAASAQRRAADNPAWMPQWRAAERPLYPKLARANGIEGACTVSFRIDRSGAVQDDAIACEPDTQFDSAMQTAVGTWRFAPYPGPGEISPYYALSIPFSLSGPDTRPDIVLDEARNRGDAPATATSTPSAVAAAVESTTPDAPATLAGAAAAPAAASGLLEPTRSDYPPFPVPDHPQARALMAQSVEKNGAAEIEDRMNAVISPHYNGRTVDLFIYESPGQTADQRRRLDALERSLPGRTVVRGDRLGVVDGEIVVARSYATAGRIVDAPYSGGDLEFLRIYGCGTDISPVTMGSAANWRAVIGQAQYDLSDERRRREAVERGDEQADERIRDQIRSNNGRINEMIDSVERACTPAGIFMFGIGMAGEMETLYYLDAGNDFGWHQANTGGWNVERYYFFMEAETPQLRYRGAEYYAEYLAAVASHIDDRVLPLSMHLQLGSEWTMGFLSLFDPQDGYEVRDARPGFHDWEARFVRSNYRLTNGHTLLTYLIERGYDPVLLRKFFADGVLDFDSALTARNAWGRTPLDMLIERGIAPETLRPDAYTEMMAPDEFEDGMYAYPNPPTMRMVEAAIVGDNVQALQWLRGRGVDLAAPVDFRFDGQRQTALGLAVALDRPAVLDFLLAEVDVNTAHPETGRTAYFEAYPSALDADGRPVPRRIAGQAVTLSTADAARLQARLRAAGADTSHRDAEGQSADSIWAGVRNAQADRNAMVLEARAEDEYNQGTLERWRREERQQTRRALAEGIAAGLQEGAAIVAEDAARERERQSARNPLNAATATTSTSSSSTSSAQTSSASSNQTSSAASTPSSASVSRADFPAEAAAVRPDRQEPGRSQTAPVYAYMSCRYTSELSPVYWFSDVYSVGDYIRSGEPGSRDDDSRLRQEGAAREQEALRFVGPLGTGEQCQEYRWSALDVFTSDQANPSQGASGSEIRDRARNARREHVSNQESYREDEIAANAPNPRIVLESTKLFGSPN